MARVTTDIDTQKKLIASLKYALRQAYLQTGDSGKRHGPHLRMGIKTIENATGLKVFFEDLIGASSFKCTVELSDNPMSGKYPTYVLRLDREFIDYDIKGPGEKYLHYKFPKGTAVYVVNTVSNRATLGNKALTPTKFQLGGKTISEKKLFDVINKRMSNLEEMKTIDDTVKGFCVEVLHQVVTPPAIRNNTDVKIHSKLGQFIKPADLAIIAKNFGEILGSAWYMSIDPEENSVEYPIEENLPLIDYFIHTPGRPLLSVSAKAGKGAPPGADDVIMMLPKMKNLTPTEKVARDVLVAMIEEKKAKGISQSILTTHKKLNTPAYQWLKEYLNKSNPTMKDIEDFLKAFTQRRRDPRRIVRGDDFGLIEELLPFFKLTGFEPDRSIRTINDLLHAKGARTMRGIIIYPLGRNLVNTFNKTDVYRSLITKVLRSLSVLQIHIYLTATTIKFVKAPFEVAEFKFEYNAGVPYPDNRPIGFKML
mgnify:CR=1 FL=1